MTIIAQITGNLSQELATDAIWVIAWPVIAALSIFILQLTLPRGIRDNETYKDVIVLWSIIAIGISAILATRIFYFFWTGSEALDIVNQSRVAQKLLFSTDAMTGEWFKIGVFDIKIGILIDNMAAAVMFSVAWIALLVQIFSWGYMRNKEHICRYFCFQTLLIGSMLAVVAGDNFLSLLISWEIMGLCAILLIGFIWQKKSESDAQRKAFLISRVGNLGLTIAIFIIMGIWIASGKPVTFRFEDFANLIRDYGISDISMTAHFRNFKEVVWGIPMYLLTASALLIFLGVAVKSAQFPLHTWLPDSTHAPAPASALINSIAVVAAGVYLIARTYFIFDPMQTGYSPALIIVAYVGTITAIIAAMIALTQYDLKHILAYATISQLGYMILALGVGAIGGALFHLISHAWFMGLLFLCAGSVIYGCRNVRDIRYMGGLRNFMPVTFMAFIAGTISLIAFPLTSGFFSKEMILHHAILSASEHPEFMIIAIFTAIGLFLTAVYMIRLIWMVFLGNNRCELIPDEMRNELASNDLTPRESPWVMLTPLLIMAAFALFFGTVTYFSKGAPDHETPLLASSLYALSHEAIPDTSAADNIRPQGNFRLLSILIVLITVFIGIWAGFRVFLSETGRQMKEALKRQSIKLYDVVYNRFYIDEYFQVYILDNFLIFIMFLRAIDKYFINGIFKGIAACVMFISHFFRWFDDVIVDGLVNGIAASVMSLARVTRYIQSGYVQNYFMLIVVTILIYMIIQERATLFKFAEVFRQIWAQMTY